MFAGPQIALRYSGQPLSEAATAARTSFTVTVPSPEVSAAGHCASGAVPRAMFTLSSNSLIVTVPL
jgi:hypothetical protein